MSNVTAFDDGASGVRAADVQMPGVQDSGTQAAGMRPGGTQAACTRAAGVQDSGTQTAGARAEDRENLTWQGFGDACRQIAQQIADSGWMPDLIVAIARGGMLPAGAISYALGVKANGAINVEFYTGVGKTGSS